MIDRLTTTFILAAVNINYLRILIDSLTTELTSNLRLRTQAMFIRSNCEILVSIVIEGLTKVLEKYLAL